MPRPRDLLWFACLAAGCERVGGGEPDVTTLELSQPKVTIALTEAGAEPRAPLRTTVQPGDHLTLEETAVVDYEVAGTPFPGSTTRQTLRVVTLDDTTSDQLHTRETVVAASIEPHPGAPPQKDAPEASAYVGRTLDSWRDPRSRELRPSRTAAKVGAPWNEDGRRPEAFVILPEEPVGIGAIWHEDITLDGHHAAVDIELVARDVASYQLRATYDSDRTLRGAPVEDVGTIWLVATSGGTLISFHVAATLTIHAPRGEVIGHETIDIARAP